MIIYAVKYSTGYDYDEIRGYYITKEKTGYDYEEIIGYYITKEKAEQKANEAEKNNQGMEFYIDEIEVEA